MFRYRPVGDPLESRPDIGGPPTRATPPAPGCAGINLWNRKFSVACAVCPRRIPRCGLPGVPPRLGTVREPAAAAAIPALRSCLSNNRFDHDDGPLTGRSNTFCGRVCEVTNGRFVEAKLEKPALGIKQLWRSMTGGYGSIAPLRGFRERSLGLHVLAAPSISPKVGDEWQVYAWSGRPPQRCPNDGFLPLPTFAHEI